MRHNSFLAMATWRVAVALVEGGGAQPELLAHGQGRLGHVQGGRS